MIADVDPAPAYNLHVERLFTQLAHAGRLRPARNVVTGEGGSYAQGARVRFWLQVDLGRVTQASFEAYGCPHVLAAASYMATWAEGQSLPQLLAWEWPPLAEFLEAPVEKWGRFLILEDAFKAAARAGGQNV